MKNDPIKIFAEWYSAELLRSTSFISSACCLSTRGLDGYPNSRFLSLKELKDEVFIITGPLNSRKGLEIQAYPKVALSFWWHLTARQIRIQGNALPLPTSIADHYFNERPYSAKIVSSISDQGEEFESLESLQDKMSAFKKSVASNIKRPANWGGFAINPLRMEFMEFKESRFHERILYELHAGVWKKKLLQP